MLEHKQKQIFSLLLTALLSFNILTVFFMPLTVLAETEGSFTVMAGAPVKNKSGFVGVVPKNVVYKQPFSFMVSFKDANDVAVTGLNASNIGLNKGNLLNIEDHNDGTYSITASHDRAVKETFKIIVNGVEFLELKDVTVQLPTGAVLPNGGNTTVLFPTEAVVNESFTITTVFRDANNNVINNIAIEDISLNKGIVENVVLDGDQYIITMSHQQVKKDEGFKVRVYGVDIKEFKMNIKAVELPGIPSQSPVSNIVEMPQGLVSQNENFTFKVEFRDLNNQTISNLDTALITLNKGILVAVVNEGSGIYKITAKHSEVKEKETFKVRYNGIDIVELKDIRIYPTMEEGTPHEYYSSISPPMGEVTVNEEFTLMLVLKDGLNNLLTNAKDKISLNKGTLVNIDEITAGSYSITLKLWQVKNDESVKIRFDGKDILEVKPIIVVAPSGVTLPTKNNSNITMPVTEVIVDKDFTFTITIKDVEGKEINSIPKHQVALNKGTLVDVVENGYGVYTLTARHSVIKKETFKVLVYGVEIGELKDIEVKMGEIPIVNDLADGEYFGTGNGRNGAIKVRLVILNGRITVVEVIEHKESVDSKNYQDAEKVKQAIEEVIPTEILNKQSIAVDTVTKATITSNGIRQAVYQALSSASSKPLPQPIYTDTNTKATDTYTGATAIIGDVTKEDDHKNQTAKAVVKLSKIKLEKQSNQHIIGSVGFEEISKIFKEHKDVKKIEIVIEEEVKKLELKLDKDSIRELNKKEVDLTLIFNGGSYTIPYKITSLNELIATKGELKGVNLIVEKVSIPVETSTPKLLVEPMKFTLEAEFSNEKFEISYFGKQYLERRLVIDHKIDTRKATGVVLENGVWKTVPTVFVEEGDKIIAVIKRNSNSIYSVMENSITFKDIEKHWGKEDIELLAAKKIVEGINGEFMPEKLITRAEFATMLVRSLGLKATKPTLNYNFKDVVKNSWYEEYVSIAVEYGIVEGYNDGTFKPNKEITREEMIVMVMRVVQLIEGSTQLSPIIEIPVSITPSQLSDGEYSGVGTGLKGKIKVNVKIRSGSISIIEVIEINDTKGYVNIALRIIDDIIEKQSTEVDTITTATVSSRGIREAVGNALENAFINSYYNEKNSDKISTKTIDFIDQEEINLWAKGAVQSALKEGIIRGYENGKLKPQDNSKRAEAVTVIKRMLVLLELIAE